MLGMPRDEMLSRMSSKELTDWIAYMVIKSEERAAREAAR
jgi:hypothetical protein